MEQLGLDRSGSGEVRVCQRPVVALLPLLTTAYAAAAATGLRVSIATDQT